MECSTLVPAGARPAPTARPPRANLTSAPSSSRSSPTSLISRFDRTTRVQPTRRPRHLHQRYSLLATRHQPAMAPDVAVEETAHLDRWGSCSRPPPRVCGGALGLEGVAPSSSPA